MRLHPHLVYTQVQTLNTESCICSVHLFSAVSQASHCRKTVCLYNVVFQLLAGVTAQRGCKANWTTCAMSSMTLQSSKISTDMPLTSPEWVCCLSSVCVFLFCFFFFFRVIKPPLKIWSCYVQRLYFRLRMSWDFNTVNVQRCFPSVSLNIGGKVSTCTTHWIKRDWHDHSTLHSRLLSWCFCVLLRIRTRGVWTWTQLSPCWPCCWGELGLSSQSSISSWR